MSLVIIDVMTALFHGGPNVLCISATKPSCRRSQRVKTCSRSSKRPLASVEARMMARNSWLRIWADAWSLGIDASSVIRLGAMKIAAGGAAAEKEAYRMVSEKIEAGLTLQRKALNGGLGNTALDVVAKTLGHLRPKVRANRRRLARRR